MKIKIEVSGLQITKEDAEYFKEAIKEAIIEALMDDLRGADVIHVETIPEVALCLVHWGPAKILVIKAIRTFTGFGLKEAKDLVESAPVEIPAGLLITSPHPYTLAEAAKMLREAGATVEETPETHKKEEGETP